MFMTKTFHDFEGKYLTGRVRELWTLDGQPGIELKSLIANKLDLGQVTIDLSQLYTMEIGELIDLRRDLTEIINLANRVSHVSHELGNEDKEEEPKGLIISVEKCQRCGKDHRIKFMNLITPVDNKYTMWGMCENTHQPVLMGMKDIDNHVRKALDELANKSESVDKMMCLYCNERIADGVCYSAQAPSAKNPICHKCFSENHFHDIVEFKAYGNF